MKKLANLQLLNNMNLIRKYKNIKSTILIITVVISVLNCTQEVPDKERILATVADKTISLNEFLRRAEYTIRPSYCKGNSNIDKKIILNSLISEKLFSLEAKDSNEFLNKKHISDYLLGRKEQAMRQLLYKNEVTDKVELEQNLIDSTSKYGSREFDISYISVKDTIVVNQLKEEFFKYSFDWDTNLKENYNLNTIPTKKVLWNSSENYKILDLLFTKNIKKNSIYGPIRFSDDHYMFFKVKGWTESKKITASQQSIYLKNIKDVYRQRQSRSIYEKFIKKVMSGKSINFSKNTFFMLADIMGPIYMKSREEREEIFKKGIWAYDKEQQKYKELKPKIDDIKANTLYSIDGKNYSVSDFLKELKIHPLVFRKKKISQKEFGFQLQMAIIDQIRDKYLTKIAYSKKLDGSKEIVRNVNMWRDYLNSVNYKFRFLISENADTLYSTDNINTIKTIIEPHVKQLQNKYSEKIFINTTLFNEIKISRIDMSVNYNNAPYTFVVPNFPLITTNNVLNYGRKKDDLN